uniref:Phospholipase A2 domain-containing protein n=1 Tax=Strongyloides stercoralis TaxID=6248 RepID=A0AAF5CWC0_STRER
MLSKFLLLLALIIHSCDNVFGKSLISAVKSQLKQSLSDASSGKKLDRFYCGTDGLVSYLAESKMVHSCPSKYDEANMCCYEHDHCYSLQQGQELCDEIFCDCLTQNVAGNGTDTKCVGTANYFCETVKDFGSDAYYASATVNPSKIDDNVKSSIENQTSDYNDIPSNSELVTTTISTAIPTVLLHFSECKDWNGITLNFCINKLDECQHDDKNDKDLCSMNFCDCLSNRITREELDNIHPECKNKLVDYCPTIPVSSSFDLNTNSLKLKDTLWELCLTYSSFIYLGLVIGYLHSYPLKYEQAPSELSQVGILSDLTMNMTDVTLLTPTKLKPSTDGNLEF